MPARNAQNPIKAIGQTGHDAGNPPPDDGGSPNAGKPGHVRCPLAGPTRPAQARLPSFDVKCPRLRRGAVEEVTSLPVPRSVHRDRRAQGPPPNDADRMIRIRWVVVRRGEEPAPARRPSPTAPGREAGNPRSSHTGAARARPREGRDVNLIVPVK